MADRNSPPDAQMHIADTPRRSEAEQQAFFDQVHGLARQAIAAVGGRQHDLRVAGITIRMIFAGSALEEVLLPAMRHLVVAPVEKPDITLNIWDSESTGVAMAPSPFTPDSFTDRGDIWGFQSKHFRSAFHWIEFSLNLMDVDSGTGIYWVRSVKALPFWTKSSPFRSLIHWSLEKHGGQLIHAAAVGYKDGAVLITGRGGVGKSTTSLACVSAGLFYVADDYLAVTLDPEPMAHSLYCTAKVNRDQMARFPEFAPLLAREPQEEGEKAVMLLYPGRTEQVLPCLPLKAILTPSFGKTAETDFRAVLPATLQGAASFTTLSQLPHAGQRTVDFIQELVRRLPGLEMVLGHDVARVPDAIRRLLDMPAAERQAIAQTPTAAVSQLPLISVIIPVYNGARFLAQAVETVLKQNYPAIEIIVIDDGSSDEIEAAVRDLPTDVRFFRQDNGGAASARNRGVRDASGEYLAFLDVDDLWPENKIAVMVESLLANSALDVVQGFAQVMTRNPESGVFEYSGNPEESYPFYIGAALYRRRAFETIGLFDPSLRFSEDSDWFARAREAGLMIKRLEQVTLLVRRHGDNMTSGKSMIELNALQVLKKALDRKRSQSLS
ncbi:MAG: glycosyltransferase [Rhizomicrobium sp.]